MMIELPILGENTIKVDTVVSPSFCRLKSGMTSLKLTNLAHICVLQSNQVYIAVWDMVGMFYIYQNGVLYPLSTYQEYFEFYHERDKAWYNDEDTVVLEDR